MTTEWTAPRVERADPDKVAAERRALEQWLDYQRDTLLTKCAGLTAAQLKQRAVPPSNLSLLGLVRHLADVERGWLRQCAGGEDVPDLYYTEVHPQADFDEIETADAEADLDVYRRELVAARAPALGLIASNRTRRLQRSGMHKATSAPSTVRSGKVKLAWGRCCNDRLGLPRLGPAIDIAR